MAEDAKLTELPVSPTIGFNDLLYAVVDGQSRAIAAKTLTSAVQGATELIWNAGTDAYNTNKSGVSRVHENMKRCVLNDDGTVAYYLDPTDSTKKADGTAADLSGGDGNVMVEIPKFYFRQTFTGNERKWEVSDLPLAGFVLHPAFIKNGVEVDFRYIGAYDACYLDATDGTYKSGLNLDDMTGNLDLANDRLASVAGVHPIVGITRAEARALAANVGAGWRQLSFWLVAAIQMLYFVEYGDFNSQAKLGAGNTNGIYPASSADQNDSPHTIAGASNAWGNGSTDGTQPSAGTNPGTAYMSYRGIENLFGNCMKWVDGFNINNNQAYVSNTDTDFADNTASNYDEVGVPMPDTNNYITDIQDVKGAFLPASVGGSSSTFLSDNYSQGTGWRVALFGGYASAGATVGAFCWILNLASANAGRGLGARLEF